jgi:hypothetical protein
MPRSKTLDDHRVYLAAALSGVVFMAPRGAALVGAFDTWALCVEQIVVLSDTLFDRWRRDCIVWGEDLDQYDVLDKIADLWFDAVTAKAVFNPTQIVLAAITASNDAPVDPWPGSGTLEG